MGDLFGGKGGGGGSSTQVQYLPEQIQDIQKTQAYKWDKAIPGIEKARQEAEGAYQATKDPYGQAAGQASGTWGQIGQTVGETGESALRTGISGLENLFGKDYEAQQIQAALAPAQAQYMQNMATNAASFGGAGQLGSARQALAQGQLASANAANMGNIAAQTAANIAGQRLSAANQLAQLGQSGLGMAGGAADKQVGYAKAPMDLAQQYAQGQYQLPGATYTPPYPGTNSSSTEKDLGISDAIGIGSTLYSLFSDIRTKENIKRIGTESGIPVYKFNYVWDKTPREGVMAQDLLDTAYKSAVSTHSSGYYTVDYAKLPATIRNRAFPAKE